MTTVLVPVSTDTLAKLLASRRTSHESFDDIIDRFGANAGNMPAMPVPKAVVPSSKNLSGKYHVTLLGEPISSLTLADLLYRTLYLLHDLDNTILGKLSRKGGRRRPLVARDPRALYPGSPHLRKHALSLPDGWWVGTNYSRADIKRILRIVCDTTGLYYGADLVFDPA